MTDNEPTSGSSTAPDSDAAAEPEPANRTGGSRLTAAKRRATRYGERARNKIDELNEGHEGLGKYGGVTINISALLVAFIIATNPAAAQACGESLGAFVSDMQMNIAAIVLGIVVIAVLIGAAFAMFPFLGGSLGWAMITGAFGVIIVIILVFWLLGLMGDYSVISMSEACTPFF